MYRLLCDFVRHSARPDLAGGTPLALLAGCPSYMIRLWAVAQQGAQAHHGGSRSQLHSLELDHFNQVVDMCHAKHEWSQENCLHVAAALHYRYTSIWLPLLH